MKEIGFNSLSSYATVSHSCDNQFIPSIIGENFNSSDKSHRLKKKEETKRELIRSLLYSSEVIFNRIALFNNEVFYDFYNNPNETKALWTLLNDGKIVPILYKESSLTDIDALKNQKFDIKSDSKKAFDFIETLNNSDAKYSVIGNNTLNTGALEKLHTQFDRFFATLKGVKNENVRDKIANEFKMKKKRNEFKKHLNSIAKEYNDINENEVFNTREKFYTKWVTVDSTNNTDIIIDDKKPFSYETKQLLDLVYNHNLSAITSRYYFTPIGHPTPLILPENYQDELGNIKDDIKKSSLFYKYQELQTIPNTSKLTLEDLVKIHATQEWKDYINAQKNFFDNPALWSKETLKEYATLLSNIYSKISTDHTEMKDKLVKVHSAVYVAIKIGGVLLEFNDVDNATVYTEIIGLFENTTKKVAITIVQAYYHDKMMTKLYDKFETVIKEVDMTIEDFKDFQKENMIIETNDNVSNKNVK